MALAGLMSRATRIHLLAEKIDAGRVATRPGEAGDKTKLDRVFTDTEHDGDCRRRCFGRKRGGGVCGRGDSACPTLAGTGADQVALELG
jgi:hypothetical protein